MFPGREAGPGLQDSEGTDPFVAAAALSPPSAVRTDPDSACTAALADVVSVAALE